MAYFTESFKFVFVVNYFFAFVACSLVEFRDAIHCATGRNSFASFNGYGCHCGFGGRGDPVDEIDRCCYEHDRCYEKSRENNVCNRFLIYVTPYTWQCQLPGRQPQRNYFSLALKTLKMRDDNSGTLPRPLPDISNVSVIHPAASPQGIPVCIVSSCVNYSMFASDSPIQCGKLLCTCDVLAALCFANYLYPEVKPKCKFHQPTGRVIASNATIKF